MKKNKTMKLEIFTTTTKPNEAIDDANQRISEMMSAGWIVSNLLQSESSSWDEIQEKENYTFNITVCFTKKSQI